MPTVPVSNGPTVAKTAPCIKQETSSIPETEDRRGRTSPVQAPVLGTPGKGTGSGPESQGTWELKPNRRTMEDLKGNDDVDVRKSVEAFDGGSDKMSEEVHEDMELPVHGEQKKQPGLTDKADFVDYSKQMEEMVDLDKERAALISPKESAGADNKPTQVKDGETFTEININPYNKGIDIGETASETVGKELVYRREHAVENVKREGAERDKTTRSQDIGKQNQNPFSLEPKTDATRREYETMATRDPENSRQEMVEKGRGLAVPRGHAGITGHEVVEHPPTNGPDVEAAPNPAPAECNSSHDGNRDDNPEDNRDDNRRDSSGEAAALLSLVNGTSDPAATPSGTPDDCNDQCSVPMEENPRRSGRNVNGSQELDTNQIGWVTLMREHRYRILEIVVAIAAILIAFLIGQHVCQKGSQPDEGLAAKGPDKTNITGTGFPQHFAPSVGGNINISLSLDIQNDCSHIYGRVITFGNKPILNANGTSNLTPVDSASKYSVSSNGLLLYLVNVTSFDAGIYYLETYCIEGGEPKSHSDELAEIHVFQTKGELKC